MIQEIPYKNRDEWLAIRQKYIGGSDAGAVVGLDSFKSPYSLWAEKTGKIPAFEGNITTKVGAYLEELVAQMFTDETGKKVRKKNFTVINDNYPFACANVDRMIVGEKALLEIKTTNSVPVMRKCRNGEYPEKWYCQMMHYLAVTGLEKAYLAVLIECREFKIFELSRDEEEIEALMRAEADFWQCVENDIPPQVDGSPATTEAVSERYPEADRTMPVIDLTGAQDKINSYIQLKAQEKALKALIDECGNSIKEQLKTAEKGQSATHTVSWSNSVRTSFDQKAFEADYKDVDLSKYKSATNVRTFRITERK